MIKKKVESVKHPSPCPSCARRSCQTITGKGAGSSKTKVARGSHSLALKHLYLLRTPTFLSPARPLPWMPGSPTYMPIALSFQMSIRHLKFSISKMELLSSLPKMHSSHSLTHHFERKLPSFSAHNKYTHLYHQLIEEKDMLIPSGKLRANCLIIPLWYLSLF